MNRVKVFTSPTASLIEDQINEWLGCNQHIKITDTQFCISQGREGNGKNFFCLVVYELPR